MTKYEADVLVIGSGIAGLFTALKLATHYKVLLITKEGLKDTATHYAQGGMASPVGNKESVQSHIHDTSVAGAGLCDERVVQTIITEAPERLKELIELGVSFSKENGQFHLTREGGHSDSRVFHYKDITGREIQRALTAQILNCENIVTLENHMAVDLIVFGNKCFGAYVLDLKTESIKTIKTNATVLASGGAGKVYLYTSNPDIATGDGIAMAARRGALIANMEFFQFHPTCLYHPKAKSFLITEALRGEGAKLVDGEGRAFMSSYDERAELAPRDIVARAIDYEMKKTGAECVYLDISFKSTSFIRERFPMIYERCLQFGMDMTQEPIPVVPAAHYCCGGVHTNLHGETSISGLYAVGETAHTGLHGANRLASNSLTEAVVMGHRTALSIHESFKNLKAQEVPTVKDWDSGIASDSDEIVLVSHMWDEIRRFMWNYVGIVRSDKRLERALRRILLIKEEINHYYWNFIVTKDLLELRNIATVAELIVRSALSRRESRGLHYNLDVPHQRIAAENSRLYYKGLTK
ncbi:MAG TPA: L-aspartate oxidase [Bdellovibrionota bacterium]|nr:L-aspartate oxidase [Bdellovibrionota bacterium]